MAGIDILYLFAGHAVKLATPAGPVTPQLAPGTSTQPHASDSKLTSRNHASLFKQLSQLAAKWDDIGRELGFKQGELDNIKDSPLLLSGAPLSWLGTMLSQWLEWAPGDSRGSRDFATLEGLKDALRQANLGSTAHDLHS